MSQLSLFSGPNLRGPDLFDEPMIYSFKDFTSRQKSRSTDKVADRAKLQKENQSCPGCSRITVKPIELRDGQIGRNGARIAGTGTLVGFTCHACGHEWPV